MQIFTSSSITSYITCSNKPINFCINFINFTEEVGDYAIPSHNNNNSWLF